MYHRMRLKGKYWYGPRLKQFSMGHGYYPKHSKSVLIVHPDIIKAGKRFGLRHGFKVCTSLHYLGDFIRDKNSRRDWLKNYVNMGTEFSHDWQNGGGGSQ